MNIANIDIHIGNFYSNKNKKPNIETRREISFSALKQMYLIYILNLSPRISKTPPDTDIERFRTISENISVT